MEFGGSLEFVWLSFNPPKGDDPEADGTLMHRGSWRHAEREFTIDCESSASGVGQGRTR